MPSPPPTIRPTDLVVPDAGGLFVPAADLWIDPRRPVPRALVTHGHADHARSGSEHYLAAASGAEILRLRLGREISLQTLEFGEVLQVGDARISLHPAGHVLGSAQVRIEVGGDVTVVTGDYKRQPDPSAEPFELVPCRTLVSECTFGLPVYRWPDPSGVMEEVLRWWEENREAGRTSILCGYAFGKAQRLLASLTPLLGDDPPAPILVHGAVERLLPPYRQAGIHFPPTDKAGVEEARAHKGRALVIAPPSAAGTPWTRKFGPVSVGFASGWMRVRGMRRRRAGDRGFVLSDHVDWDGLMDTVEETGAERVLLTHGAATAAVRFLREERGLAAVELPREDR
ncbi:MAG: ligase-associated DNA damage response exonuclease [Gemmatimonadales bacterium]|nr:MAG: ligase-associated DNA damage response exonuclease [Gemmatimonadales bacterium]